MGPTEAVGDAHQAQFGAADPGPKQVWCVRGRSQGVLHDVPSL